MVLEKRIPILMMVLVLMLEVFVDQDNKANILQKSVATDTKVHRDCKVLAKAMGQ